MEGEAGQIFLWRAVMDQSLDGGGDERRDGRKQREQQTTVASWSGPLRDGVPARDADSDGWLACGSGVVVLLAASAWL
jgi:hypothetical protein